jgi:hypothetical protein
MIEWLFPYVDTVVAAANFTTVVMMVLVGAISTYLLVSKEFDHSSDIKTILLGVTIEAYAWGLHRLYWGTWRVLRSWGHDDWNQWFVNHSFLSLIPSTLVLVGLSFILAPVWGFLLGGHTPGRKYYVLPWVLMISIWWMFFGIILANDKEIGDVPLKPATVFHRDIGEVNEDSSICHCKK